MYTSFLHKVYWHICGQGSDYKSDKFTEIEKSHICDYLSTKHSIRDPTLKSILSVSQITDPDLRSSREEMSFIRIFFNDKVKTVNMIEMTAAATLIDMISNIGGTLGLFCGLSILSLVEILYWGCKFGREKVKPLVMGRFGYYKRKARGAKRPQGQAKPVAFSELEAMISGLARENASIRQRLSAVEKESKAARLFRF